MSSVHTKLQAVMSVSNDDWGPQFSVENFSEFYMAFC